HLLDPADVRLARVFRFSQQRPSCARCFGGSRLWCPRTDAAATIRCRLLLLLPLRLLSRPVRRARVVTLAIGLRGFSFRGNPESVRRLASTSLSMPRSNQASWVFRIFIGSGARE